MTREEAIRRIQDIERCTPIHTREDVRDFEALDMAIKALEVEPKTGRWIAYEVRLPDRTILNYRCSVCGRKLIGYSTETLSEAPFCHCGAKMVEPQERSDKK